MLTNICNKYSYNFLLFGLLKSANNVTIFIQSVRSTKSKSENRLCFMPLLFFNSG